MSYVALYRKFRPDTFDEVRGQDAIVRTLRNQITAGRIGHAYLFVGTRGTGKTSVAKIFARAVNCEAPQNGSPCGSCAVCRAMEEGAALNITELDAASNNSVEDVRQIIDEIDYSPAIGRYRVYIIDEVHMFSTSAFNALLKTLEEPPAHVIFILATTEAAKIPVTILSRCQRYDFRRISLEEIQSRLAEVAEKEGIRVTPEALGFIARSADGAMRDGLSLLDRCASFHYGEELTLDMALDVLGAVEVEVYGRLFDAVSGGDVAEALSVIADAVADGRDLTQFVGDLIWFLRNLMLIKAAGDASHLTDISSENKAFLSERADETDLDSLLRYIRVFSELASQIRYSTQKRILTEAAVIRLMRPQTEAGDSEASSRLSALEDRLDRGERRLSEALTRIKNAPPAAASVENTNAPDGGGSDDNKALAEQIAKALPEETRRAVERMREITGRLEDPSLRAVLGKSVIRVDEEGSIVIPGESVFWSDADDEVNERRIEEISRAVIDVTGKRAEIRLEKPGEKKNGNAVPADDIFAALGIEVTEDKRETDIK